MCLSGSRRFRQACSPSYGAEARGEGRALAEATGVQAERAEALGDGASKTTATGGGGTLEQPSPPTSGVGD